MIIVLFRNVMNKFIPHILLADSDNAYRMLLCDFLHDKGYEVDQVSNGADLLERLHRTHYDLLLLEMTLDGQSSMEYLRQLRDSGNNLAVLILTSRNIHAEIIQAFQYGCDDYQLKPIATDLLLCRIEALLRRAQIKQISATEIYQLGDKCFNATTQQIEEQHLSSRESALLLIFCQHMGQLVDRHFILRTIWENDDYFSARSLAVYINRLRRLLKSTPFSIISIHGKGYKLISNE